MGQQSPEANGSCRVGPKEGSREGWPGDYFVQVSQTTFGAGVRQQRWEFEVPVKSLRPFVFEVLAICA